MHPYELKAICERIDSMNQKLSTIITLLSKGNESLAECNKKHCDCKQNGTSCNECPQK